MKTKRHAKILELIEQYSIDTQEELLRCLKEHGYNITQATVSRDIKELRLVKSLDSDGKYRYVAAKTEHAGISSKFRTIFADAVLSMDSAQNLIIIKCYSGMANAACAALDSMLWEGVAGTLAGDDTILVVCRTSENAQTLMQDLKSFHR